MSTVSAGQRMGGAFMALVGGGFTLWIWHTALSLGHFSAKGALVMPAFFVLGAALVVFPGYRQERLARGEDISRLSGWHLITTRWRTILAIALLSGIANFVLLVTTRG